MNGAFEIRHVKQSYHTLATEYVGKLARRSEIKKPTVDMLNALANDLLYSVSKNIYPFTCFCREHN